MLEYIWGRRIHGVTDDTRMLSDTLTNDEYTSYGLVGQRVSNSLNRDFSS